MSFFEKKTAAGAERLTAALSALTAAGIPVDASAPIPTPEAVASAIDTRIKSATEPLAAQLATEHARAEGFVAALTASGIAIPALLAADFAPGADSAEVPAVAAIRGAIEAAVARRSAKVVAATGHPEALAIPANSEAATAAKTSAELMEEFNTISDAAARAEFFSKHRAAMFGR